MKTILLPTDFSENSRIAAEYAMTLFSDEKVRFVLLNAFQFAPRSTEIKMAALKSEIGLESEKLLRRERLGIINGSPEGSFEIETHAAYGDFTNAIINYTMENKVDYIVMGSQKANKLKELLAGSQIYYIMSKVSTPIISVPNRPCYKRPERILLAVDWKAPVNVPVFNQLKQFAVNFGASYTVLNITNGDMAEESGQREKLKEIFGNTVISFTYMKGQDIAVGIEKYMAIHHADLLVTLPGSTNIVDRIFKKRITRSLMQQSEIPMLAIRNMAISG